MRHYEIVVLIRSGQSAQAAAMSERYKKMVADGGGAVHRFEDWGRRMLAYPIQKRNFAYYFLFNIECEQEVVDKLREDFRFSESVIRFLLVRRDHAITEMSPIAKAMQAAEEKKAEQDKQDNLDRELAAKAEAKVEAEASKPAAKAEPAASESESESAVEESVASEGTAETVTEESTRDEAKAEPSESSDEAESTEESESGKE